MRKLLYDFLPRSMYLFVEILPNPCRHREVGMPVLSLISDLETLSSMRGLLEVFFLICPFFQDCVQRRECTIGSGNRCSDEASQFGERIEGLG